MFQRMAIGGGVGGGRMGRFLVTCMVLGFFALALAGGAAVWSTLRNEDHTAWVNHTYEVELAIGRANNLIELSETARRGYLLGGRSAYLDTYRKGMARLPAAVDRIATLTRDNPRQQHNIAQLRARIVDLIAQRERTIVLTERGDRAGATALFERETDARRMIGLRALADAMVGEEQRLLAIRDAEQRASVRAFYVTLIIAGLLLVVVAILSLLTVLRYTADLGQSRDSLRDFADTLEDQVRERTHAVTRANEEIQRFAYIVSHDLRSPLVNVMGFTAELDGATAALRDLVERAEATAPEIVTPDARAAACEDLPEAIGFIRTSTQKMDRLINAILKLSREGRRVIAPEKLDLATMVSGIKASLTQQIDQRGATIVVEGTLPDITSDRLAIEQIFSNLIENAVKYLDPRRPGHIVVRGRRHGSQVTFEFEDNGRGIAASDYTRVFDLFRRAGNQDQPGEGIGLAHVRALAYRLGGVIDVTSELGQGTTFRLTLPQTYVEPATPDSGKL